jgi:precorrin-4/cobalt-precorrin-4 C11-methyltransferase
MVLYLSAGLLDKVSADLIAGGLDADTPAAIVYKASWKDEKVCRCTVGTLKQTAEKNGINKTALITVGDFLKGSDSRSRLYDPGFSTEYREAKK